MGESRNGHVPSIDFLERASGRGVAALKKFLSYAKTGSLGVAERSGREEESPFEEAVRQVAGWITPVPGGVGPMTRAMLLVNTLTAVGSAETMHRADQQD